MLKSNIPRVMPPSPLGTHINTSRDNILDEIGEEDHDEDDELTKAMDFVCLYELRKHELGLSSVVRTNREEPKSKQALGRKKNKGKVERLKESRNRPDASAQQFLPSSQDTSFRTQRRLNARPPQQEQERTVDPARNPVAAFTFDPHNSIPSQIRPFNSVSDFMTDQSDYLGKFGHATAENAAAVQLPKWNDFRVEMAKDPHQNHTKHHYSTAADNPTARYDVWQTPPLQRVDCYEPPSFIKPMYSYSQASIFSPSGRYEQESNPNSHSYAREFARRQHKNRQEIKRRLHYEEDSEDEFYREETRSMYESPSRPFMTPPSSKKVARDWVQTSSSRNLRQQNPEQVIFSEKGKPIAVLSLEHELQLNRNGVRTSQKPMKHSQSHYVFKESSEGNAKVQMTHQQSDSEEPRASVPMQTQLLHKDFSKRPAKQIRNQKTEQNRKRSPQVPAKKEQSIGGQPKKTGEKIVPLVGAASEEPKTYFREGFADELKTLISSKTISKIHVDVQNPKGTRRDASPAGLQGSYESHGEDDLDGAMNESLEQFERKHQKKSRRDDSFAQD